MSDIQECFFCVEKFNKAKDVFIIENEHFYARWDQYPVSPGHALIIPKFHVETYFDVINHNRMKWLDELLYEVKLIIDQEYEPDGYNIGINQGEAAGQTIFHLHVHLIPRYKGDVENPIGGVRHIIPGKGNY